MDDNFFTSAEAIKTYGAIIALAYSLGKAWAMHQDWYGLRARAVNAVFDKAVAWVFHNYMRDKIDAAEAAGTPVSKADEQQAHRLALSYVDQIAPKADYRAGKVIDKMDVREKSAEIVSALARRKNGVSHTGPTTKGA